MKLSIKIQICATMNIELFVRCDYRTVGIMRFCYILKKVPVPVTGGVIAL
jgi:hypothetical protein